MRLPFAQWGWPELIKFGVGALTIGTIGLIGLISGMMITWVAIVLMLIFLPLAAFVFWFFRDPDRPLPGDHLDIISPADGVVTHSEVGIEGCDEWIEGKSHYLGIFLNVFNVHVNRAPLDGRVTYLHYRSGQFLDARHPEVGRLNEQQVIGMYATKAGNARVLVKQIAGAIARRIICPLEPEVHLQRGERFGMIKFGSRTEIWVDGEAADVQWLVKVGDKVVGGSTIVGRITPKSQE